MSQGNTRVTLTDAEIAASGAITGPKPMDPGLEAI
nr:MAG TPA: hypothetical protein [Bacteriophage sp.]